MKKFLLILSLCIATSFGLASEEKYTIKKYYSTKEKETYLKKANDGDKTAIKFIEARFEEAIHASEDNPDDKKMEKELEEWADIVDRVEN